MSNPTELLNCPFCGSHDVHLTVRDDNLDTVMCDECTAEGPAFNKTSLAAEWWNRRAQPEGEAPQAEARIVTYVPSRAKKGVFKITAYGPPDMELPPHREILSDRLMYPAAQHAESGALDWPHAPGRDGAQDAPPNPALAAQSQGAQAAQPECQAEPGAWSECQRRTIELYTTLQGPRAAAGRAQQAAAPGALDLLNADELAALRRFDETCQDGEGYDVPKAMMQRLAAIGVVRRTSGSYYETTDFGMRVLDQPAPNASGTPEAPQTAAARDVLAERQRQVEVEGWTPAHDDQYEEWELSRAAIAYAQAYTPHCIPCSWPWNGEWFKPADDRRNMVKAGALILAEIERLDRAAQLDGGQGEGNG